MSRRALSVFGSAVFLVIAPGLVAVLVPWLIAHWRLQPSLFGLQFFRYVGGMFMTLGIVGLLDSFWRFAIEGLGTPAPLAPTRHLVVTGLYRYVRNPMYAAVVSTIFGQALLFGSVALVAYGGVVWLLCHLFVLLYEEPNLRARFGFEYDKFRASVPRWIPRLNAATMPNG